MKVEIAKPLDIQEATEAVEAGGIVRLNGIVQITKSAGVVTVLCTRCQRSHSASGPRDADAIARFTFAHLHREGDS